MLRLMMTIVVVVVVVFSQMNEICSHFLSPYDQWRHQEKLNYYSRSKYLVIMTNTHLFGNL